MIIDPYNFRQATIVKIVRHASTAMSMQLVVEGVYDFLTGQHAIVRITMPDGSKLVRQYSFSSPPDNHELWLTIVEQPNGAVSGWCNKTARVGNTIELSHPFSGPLMQKTPRGQICIIAGGSGIGPCKAWVQALRNEHRTFSLLYSTRTSERCFKQELIPQDDETITIRLTDIDKRLTQQEITSQLTPGSTVFICGSRPFVLAMRDYCKSVVSPEKIYSEAFSL